MAKIGSLTLDKDGSYKGSIATLGLNISKITMRPVETITERGPSFRVFAGFGEVGAAFPAQADGKEYLSIKLDGPTLAEPIYCAAFASKDKPETDLDLVWSRSKPRD